MKPARPKARSEGLLVRDLGDEVVVYELASHRGHCLNRTAALVWRACDGRSTIAAVAVRVARELGVPACDDVVGLALRQLRHARLLDPGAAEPTEPSRRRVARRIGQVVLLPAVTSLLVPKPSEAATCPCTAGVVCSCAGQDIGTTCWDGNDCSNNFCDASQTCIPG